MSESPPGSPAARLAALAPSVDMDASRRLFERRRGAGVPVHRRLLPAAVITLLIAGVVGVWAIARDDGGTAPIEPVDQAEPTGEEFELLAVARTTRVAGTIETATDADQLGAVLAALSEFPQAVADSVDFDRTVVVVFNMPGNSCQYDLDRFEVDGDVWTPKFFESGGNCDDVGITWSYLVGVERAALGDQVTFRIPPEFGGEAIATITLEAPSPAEYAVVLVERTSAPTGSIETATTVDEFNRALEPIDDTPFDPGIDFREPIVVVVFNVPGNACPDELIGFDISGASKDVWSPRFRSSDLVCEDIGLTWAHVIVFDRAAFGSSVTFVMKDDETSAAVDEPAPGEEFEMIAVEATSVPFGTIRVAQDDASFDEWWRTDLPDVEVPDVDFAQSFVVAFTLPDDACPDLLVQFVGEQIETGAIWTPQFEPPPGGCDQPLITRTYVVRVDRPAVTADITFRLPADDVYEYGPTETTITIAPATATVRFDETVPEPTATGVPELAPVTSGPVATADLPEIGSASASMSLAGPIWIVQHDDGTVSALPGVVELPEADEAGVTGVGRLVTWDGERFAGRWIHDEYGRALNGPRSDDLVGFEARVDGASVDVFRSNRDRIPGAPIDVPLEGDHGLPPLDLGPTIELDVLPTLSFRGPAWRLLEASLVVENVIGRLCVVDPDVSVPELRTCDGDGVDTAVTSTRPDITSWFFGPVLAEFDEFGRIITVVPLGGSASRIDGPDGGAGQPTKDG